MRQAKPSSNSVNGNRLLAALPPKDYKRLAGVMEDVSLELKQDLFRQDKPITHVYFPYNGVCSLVTMMRDGSVVEIATATKE
jgi:hypothetical protein